MLRLEQRKSITGQEYHELSSLIWEFIQVTQDKEYTVDSTIDQIFHSDVPMGLWLVYEGVQMVGYCFVELVETRHEVFTAFHHLYIRSRKPAKIYEKLWHEVAEWSKPLGSKSFLFTTKRNPKAFMRLLKQNWKLDSYILRAPLE